MDHYNLTQQLDKTFYLNSLITWYSFVILPLLWKFHTEYNHSWPFESSQGDLPVSFQNGFVEKVLGNTPCVLFVVADIVKSKTCVNWVRTLSRLQEQVERGSSYSIIQHVLLPLNV